jgi:hypothetical protein
VQCWSRHAGVMPCSTLAIACIPWPLSESSARHLSLTQSSLG